MVGELSKIFKDGASGEKKHIFLQQREAKDRLLKAVQMMDLKKED
jgi:hypothetical protein